MKHMIWVALVVGGLVLVSAGESQAKPHGGHRSGSVQGGGNVVRGHPGFTANRPFVGHHRFEGQRHFHRGGRTGVFVGVAPFVIGPAWAYGSSYAYSPPAYEAPPTSYWYYCQSAGLY